MEDLSYIWLIAIQLAILLVAGNIFQFLFVRYQIKRVNKLKSKLAKLKKEGSKPNNTDGAYLDIDEALAHTQTLHSIGNDSSNIDILHPSIKDPTTKALTLRYAMLNAEKEALQSEEEDRWDVLEGKLTGVIAALEAEDSGGATTEEMQALLKELETIKDENEKLERQKAQFIDLKENWDSLNKSENEIIPQLIELIEGGENRNEIAGLLQELHTGFEDVTGLFFDEDADENEEAPEKLDINFFDEDEEPVEMGALAFDENLPSGDSAAAANSQVNMLTNITNDQGDLIKKLRGQLIELNMDTELEQTMKELDRLSRMMKESESCVTLLEMELQESSDSIAKLQKEKLKLNSESAEKDDVIDQLRTIRYSLEEESIATQTLDITPFDETPESGSNVIDLEKAIAQKQVEIYQLEEKHVNIETRYLELYQRYIEK